MEWIEVNKELPKNNETVIIWWFDGDVYCAAESEYYNGMFNEPYYGQHSINTFVNVQYWMIPQPPKTK